MADSHWPSTTPSQSTARLRPRARDSGLRAVGSSPSATEPAAQAAHSASVHALVVGHRRGREIGCGGERVLEQSERELLASEFPGELGEVAPLARAPGFPLARLEEGEASGQPDRVSAPRFPVRRRGPPSLGPRGRLAIARQFDERLVLPAQPEQRHADIQMEPRVSVPRGGGRLELLQAMLEIRDAQIEPAQPIPAFRLLGIGRGMADQGLEGAVEIPEFRPRGAEKPKGVRMGGARGQGALEASDRRLEVVQGVHLERADPDPELRLLGRRRGEPAAQADDGPPGEFTGEERPPGRETLGEAGLQVGQAFVIREAGGHLLVDGERAVGIPIVHACQGESHVVARQVGRRAEGLLARLGGSLRVAAATPRPGEVLPPQVVPGLQPRAGLEVHLGVRGPAIPLEVHPQPDAGHGEVGLDREGRLELPDCAPAQRPVRFPSREHPECDRQAVVGEGAVGLALHPRLEERQMRA